MNQIDIGPWIPVIVQTLILLATVYAIRSRLPKQFSEIRVDVATAADKLTAGYDRLLDEKNEQIKQRDQELTTIRDKAAIVPQQARTIEALEKELTDAKAIISQLQYLTQLRATLDELIDTLKNRR